MRKQGRRKGGPPSKQPEESDRMERSEKRVFGNVRWMEIGEMLKKASANGKKAVGQLTFEGERLDALSVRRWRERTLGEGGG